MENKQIHQYLERFFTANKCPILENKKGFLHVQLTKEMDKELMNRPFYWHYIEKTGGAPNPMKLALITDQNEAPNEKGEIIHYGSPRLHQIFQCTKKLAGFIRLYEQSEEKPHGHIPLHPWVCLNVKISYQADHKKEIFGSYGINLIYGQIQEHFFDYVRTLSMTPKIPDFSFTLTPMISPVSGIHRIRRYIEQKISTESHEWAARAIERWEDDLALLDHFYEETEEKPDAYQIEKEALREQYEPRINIDIINGGIFYLRQR